MSAISPLFKTEEQARVEDTIVDEPTSLDWPSDATLPRVAAGAVTQESESEEEEQSDESLWSRSRDFAWGD